MDYMKEFEEHLNKFQQENYDDFDLSKHGSELDIDDEGDGASFSQKPMYDQLGKVLDSRSSPKPLTTVTTDDGKELKVTADQARMIRLLMTTDKVKPAVRTKFQKDVQNSKTLVDFLDMDYHELPALFIKRYLG
jgi:hypothetical protein|tara:strand:- start:815 stop:1216 length:402 start_codon:yes stop_codon:yes gene_type:complete